MDPRNLAQYAVTPAMLKNDLGVGVITVYQLKNGMSYLVMGEYHNKGALSPTVGARFNKDQSIYDVIKDAFHRKRLGKMDVDGGDIDAENIYYSVNASQKFARLTFVQNEKIDLSEEEFKKKYIEPMHTEALKQRSVSEFFWKLDETVNPARKDSKFKFNSAEERALAAKKALDKITSSAFPVSKEIIDKLSAMQDEKYVWNEEILPLKFYEKNGGRKYSELTGFYLMSVADILKQLKNPDIKLGKTDQDKPTVFIKLDNLPQEEKWKKFFIFEDEIKVVAAVIGQLTLHKENTPLLYKSTCVSEKIEKLSSPWTLEKITVEKLEFLKMSKLEGAKI